MWWIGRVAGGSSDRTTQKTISGLNAPLVERWNGTTWKKQTTPARGTGQVWAVGEQARYTQTLVFGRCT